MQLSRFVKWSGAIWVMLVWLTGAVWSWQVIVGSSFVLLLIVGWRERRSADDWPRSVRWLYQLGGLGFPVAATLWKATTHFAEGDGLPNRLQHGVGAAATVCVLTPVFVRWWRGLDLVEAAVIGVGVVLAMGAMVELFEASYKMGLPEVYQAGAFRDTMKDLAMNLVGAAAGFVVVWVLTSGRKNNLAGTYGTLGVGESYADGV
jgi:hypothetical protein